MLIYYFRKFIRLESAGGFVLFGAALFALILANSPLSHLYTSIIYKPFQLSINTAQLRFSMADLINEGLMPLFFLLISLEIKREILEGELRTLHKAILPIIAAIAGMVFPALIYCIINYNNRVTLQGWAIPTPTDIAFCLGILTLLGKKIPLNLKIFLTALAIVDDLGAILIMGLFYSHNLNILYIYPAAFCLLLLYFLNYRSVANYLPYFIVTFILWICLLKAHIHPTLAGVFLGFSIPLKNHMGQSPLRYLEKKLHPWVAFFVLPLFALSAAGLNIKNLTFSDLFHPISFGIWMGLFIGKPMGIFSACWLVIKFRISTLSKGINRQQLMGIAMICGFGFTMSLFLGDLAFPNEQAIYLEQVKLGVLLGSILSGIFGTLILYTAKRID